VSSRKIIKLNKSKIRFFDFKLFFRKKLAEIEALNKDLKKAKDEKKEGNKFFN